MNEILKSVSSKITSNVIYFFDEKGDKDIMFPTLRKQNEENAILYAESVGELYRIEVEPKGVFYGREQGNKRKNC